MIDDCGWICVSVDVDVFVGVHMYANVYAGAAVDVYVAATSCSLMGMVIRLDVDVCVDAADCGYGC